jgi:hypothetical protein
MIENQWERSGEQTTGVGTQNGEPPAEDKQFRKSMGGLGWRKTEIKGGVTQLVINSRPHSSYKLLKRPKSHRDRDCPRRHMKSVHKMALAKSMFFDEHLSGL